MPDLPPHPMRPFADLRDSGLLWLINATVLHPRGFALALHLDDDGAAVGWCLMGDGSEPLTFLDNDPDVHRAFTALHATLDRGTPDA